MLCISTSALRAARMLMLPKLSAVMLVKEQMIMRYRADLSKGWGWLATAEV